MSTTTEFEIKSVGVWNFTAALGSWARRHKKLLWIAAVITGVPAALVALVIGGLFGVLEFVTLMSAVHAKPTKQISRAKPPEPAPAALRAEAQKLELRRRQVEASEVDLYQYLGRSIAPKQIQVTKPVVKEEAEVATVQEAQKKMIAAVMALAPNESALAPKPVQGPTPTSPPAPASKPDPEPDPQVILIDVESAEYLLEEYGVPDAGPFKYKLPDACKPDFLAAVQVVIQAYYQASLALPDSPERRDIGVKALGLLTAANGLKCDKVHKWEPGFLVFVEFYDAKNRKKIKR